MTPDCRDAILDFVLARAFTEGHLQALMDDLWNHAYILGRCDADEDRLVRQVATRQAQGQEGQP